MKHDSHLATLALIVAADASMLIATNTLADSATRIDLTFIDGLPDTGDYMIGMTDMNCLVALQKAEDGATVTTIGAAFYDVDDKFVFAQAKLTHDKDGLSLNHVDSGGVLMLGETALKLDPRHVATVLVKDNGGEYLGALMMVIEGGELQFGPETNISKGTLVDVTMLTLAKKTFLVAHSEAKGVIFAMEAQKYDKTTWVAQGNIGHLSEDGDIVDISTTGLSAFGIGISTASAGVGHDPAQRVAA